MALGGLTRATQFLRIYQNSKSTFSFLTERNIKNVSPSLSHLTPSTRHFRSEKNSAIPGKSAAPHATEESKKRKGLTSPQINLIDTNEEIKNITLEHAERLAKRRDLKLVKIVDFDTKTEKPVFKLMTNAEFFKEEAKAKEKQKKEKNSLFKDNKMFIISSKIGDNDLSIKIKQMSKAIAKKHPIRVYVSQDGNPSRAEEVVKIVEDELKEFYCAKENSKKHTSYRLLLKPLVEQENENSSKKANKKTNEKSVKEKLKAKPDISKLINE